MKTVNEDGSVEKYDYDDTSGKLIHTVSRDVTNLIEQNKREFNDSDRHYKKPMTKVASIDPIAAQNWCMKHGIKFEEFMRDQNVMRKFLADPDNAVWKTKQGKLKTS